MYRNETVYTRLCFETIFELKMALFGRKIVNNS